MQRRNWARLAVAGLLASATFVTPVSNPVSATAPAQLNYTLSLGSGGATITPTAIGFDISQPGSPPTVTTGFGTLVILGSTGPDTLTIVENEFGLPHDGAGGSTRIDFDGGAGGDDAIEVQLTTRRDVIYSSTASEAPKSGTIVVQPEQFGGVAALDVGFGPMTITFDNLEPIGIFGAGGTLIVDATATPDTTWLTIADDGTPGDGVSIITGDGGFEATSFSGFNVLIVRGGTGSETMTLSGLDSVAPPTSITLDGDNTFGTDTAADSFDVQNVPAGVAVTVLGGLPTAAPGDVMIAPVVNTPSGKYSLPDGATIEWSEIEADPDVFSLGDRVWVEINGDNLFTDGVDLPAPDGTTVELLLADGTPTGVTATTTGGMYLFEDLAAGDYYVRIPASQFAGLLAGMSAAPGGTADPDNDVDDDADHNAFDGPSGAAASGVRSGVVTLGTSVDDGGFTIGEPAGPALFNNTLDLALVAPASIQIDKEVCPFGLEQNGHIEFVPEPGPLPEGPFCDPRALPGEGGWVESALFPLGQFPVLWRWTVTNIGDQDLTNVVVTDPLVPACSFDLGDFVLMANGANRYVHVCSDLLPGTIDPNTASVTAVGVVNGQQVGDSDTASAIVAPYGISVVKKVQTNFDANSPTGPLVAVGDTVRWTYEVRNIGSVQLAKVVLLDDMGVTPVFMSGDTDNDGRLDPAEVWLYEASGVAVGGQYTNRATAMGMAVDGSGERIPFYLFPAMAIDDANYFGSAPSIKIEKYVNGVEADSPDGPFILAGSSAQFTFVVSNAGNVALKNIVVSDDVLGTITSCVDELGDPVALAGYILPVKSAIACTRSATAVAGLHGNLGSVTALGPNTIDENGASRPGTQVNADDPAYYFGSAPSVQLVKKVQTAFDANSAPGPLVAVGDQVMFTYEVTNTGNVPLMGSLFESVQRLLVIPDPEPIFGITVVDDNGTPGDTKDDELIWCETGFPNQVTFGGPGGYLAPGESVVCEPLYGTAIAGQQVNVATVTVWGPETIRPSWGDNPVVAPEWPMYDKPAPVYDADSANYFGADPMIELQKTVQTYRADDPLTVYPADSDGAVPVRDGDLVVYRYKVKNVGNVELTNLVITDNLVFDALINCGSGNLIASLLPGQSRTCVYILGDADAALHADGLTNIGGVTADSPPTVLSTAAVADGVGASDENTATFFVAQPSIDVEKYVQTNIDADDPIGPLISVNSNGTFDNVVVFRYVITNTGNVDLVDVALDDSDLGPITDCYDGGYQEIGLGTYMLEPGQVVVCWYETTAIAGEYANTGTVTATPLPAYDADGGEVPLPEVSDSDDAHYFGADPSVSLVKTTQTIDSSEETGPLVRSGDPVRWTYTVTNTGNVVLTNVTVTDSSLLDGVLIDCGDGTNVIASLPPFGDDGNVVVCEAYGVAVDGQYTNTGEVTGTPPATYGYHGYNEDGIPDGEEGDEDGEDLRIQPDETDEDVDFYYGIHLEIDVVKTTQTIDTGEFDVPLVAVGADVLWTYTVTNTGNWALVNVAVTDDQLADADIDCGDETNVIDTLEIDESVTCTAIGVATAGEYENDADATGTGPDMVDVDGDKVDADTASEQYTSGYFGSDPSIDLEKLVNGDDADTPLGLIITTPGVPLIFSYVVTNTGNVELTDVTVVDDQGVEVDCGEDTDNVIADLAVDESVTCFGTASAPLRGAYSNLGSVTASSPDTIDTEGETVPGIEVSDDDPAFVFTAVPEVDIVKYVVVDGVDQDANSAPGPLLNRYSLASWKIVVTNTGNVPLTNVVIYDATLAAEEAVLLCEGGAAIVPSLLPGASVTCTVTSIVEELGLFTNTAAVTATPVLDTSGPAEPNLLIQRVGGAFPELTFPNVTDSDSANYTGVVSGGSGVIIPRTGSDTSRPFGSMALFTMAAGAFLVIASRRRRHI